MLKLSPLGSNQTEVELNDRVTLFFSYSTCVAACIDGQFYRTDKKWSSTTSRHINKWLDGRNTIEIGQDRLDCFLDPAFLNSIDIKV